MTVISASKARASLYKLIDNVSSFHCPVHITGKRSSAILVSEDDWKNIQETLYLLSIPGMRESIVKGLNTKINDCGKKLNW